MKRWNYLEALKTKNKITKDGNDEKVPHIEFTEVVLFHGNNPIMIINMIQESCVHLF